MPFYPYSCKNCGNKFEKLLPLSQYKEPQDCPQCGTFCTKGIPKVNFNLPGDGWASKNNRIKKQMARKNARLDRITAERRKDGYKMTLAPNVDGERVNSWSDAKKLAKEKGKVTSSYDAKIREEKASK